MPTERPPGSDRPVIYMITTRALDGESMISRILIMQTIRSALSEGADLTFVQLPNLMANLTLSRVLGAVKAWAGDLLNGLALPLQCVLFASAADHRQFIANLPEDVTAVYLDGVRTYSLLVHLRKARPDLHIVVDLDDLMSRRMGMLLVAGQPLSPGYLTKRMPVALQKIALSKFVGRLIVRHERMTLKMIERRMAKLADKLVLLSSEDARLLRDLCIDEPEANIEVIPPGRQVVQAPSGLQQPIRFVFIGPDSQTQNRLTIDYLTDLWAKHGFKSELVLYGLRFRDNPLPPNVRSVGYVENLGDIYDRCSVLLTPSLIGGGIKTKVLEAFAHGVPVIGNANTFESMPVGDYPLNIQDEAELVAILADPDKHRPLFNRAAQAGARYLAEHHDPDTFARRWREIMAPGREQLDRVAPRKALGS